MVKMSMEREASFLVLILLLLTYLLTYTDEYMHASGRKVRISLF